MKYVLAYVLTFLLALTAPVYAESKTDRIQSKQIRALTKIISQQNRWIGRLRKQMDNVIENITTYKTLHAFDADGWYMGPVTNIQRYQYRDPSPSICDNCGLTGAQRITIYLADIDHEIAITWSNDSDDNFMSQVLDGTPGLYFEEINCQGPVYIREQGEGVGNIYFLRFAVVWLDRIYAIEDRHSNYYEAQMLQIDSKSRSTRTSSSLTGTPSFCENIESTNTIDVTKLDYIGDWTYELPIVVERF